MPSQELVIPEYYKPGIKLFIELNSARIRKLISALRVEQPTHYLPRGLAVHLAEKAKIPPEVVSPIIESLTGLYSARVVAGLSVDDFSEALLHAIKRDKLKAISTRDWARLKKLFVEILSLGGALAVSSKALSVVTEQDHIFTDARVITDLRSVFPQDASGFPTAMAIIHMLRINYHQSGGHRSFFVALDDNDIQNLRKVCDRAERKSTALKQVAKRANIPIVDIAGEA